MKNIIEPIAYPILEKPIYKKRKRRCKYRGCNTILSRYNMNKYCHSCHPKVIKDFHKKMDNMRLSISKLVRIKSQLKKEGKPYKEISKKINKINCRYNNMTNKSPFLCRYD